jgi:aspartyl-tRNA(Asn)/glutamyl-tRNA(Gln) amidotransferase subunit A
MPDLTSLSLLEASQLMRSRTISPVELTQASLKKIEELNPRLNAFITVTAEQALAEARQAETEIGEGKWRGPLHGVPVSLKDLIDVAGVRTTAASGQLLDNVAAEDAEIVRRLRQAGAVLVGKTNLHEFAYGGSTLVGYFGPTHNPWDLARTTGGSSGGAAAAVAAGLCQAAIGSDTAGSVRLPATLCGVVGMKPTYGAVSTRGVLPLSWSYDTLGPITRSAADAAAMLSVIAGYDPQDPASAPLPAEGFAGGSDADLSKLRVGIARDIFFDDLDPQVAEAVAKAIQVIVGFTGATQDVSVPVDPDYTVHICEAFLCHAKWYAESPDRYQPETLRRVRSGEKVTLADYVLKRRQLDHYRRGAVATTFRDVDVILTPTTPILAPEMAAMLQEPKELRRKETVLLRNTRPFNLLGGPAITLPCGLSREGLPIGLQISGRPGEDALVLAVAERYERQAGRARVAQL